VANSGAAGRQCWPGRGTGVYRAARGAWRERLSRKAAMGGLRRRGCVGHIVISRAGASNIALRRRHGTRGCVYHQQHIALCAMLARSPAACLLAQKNGISSAVAHLCGRYYLHRGEDMLLTSRMSCRIVGVHDITRRQHSAICERTSAHL